MRKRPPGYFLLEEKANMSDAKDTRQYTEANMESACVGGLRKYLVAIEEHISQEFSIQAEDIAHAMDKAKEAYCRGQLVVQPSAPVARLMMARSADTEEETEWKEF